MMKRVILLFCLAGALLGQVTSGTTSRIRLGASLPATCAVADVFYKTTATTGQYNCTATNTWTIVNTAATTIGGSLPTAGAVPYVSAANTLAEMSRVTWESVNGDLSVKTPGGDQIFTVSENLDDGDPTANAVFGINPVQSLVAGIRATSNGRHGPDVLLYAVGGGNTSITTTGTGGTGGNTWIYSGLGGTCTSTTVQCTGGAGGTLLLNAGDGGTASTAGADYGGTGGALRIVAGNGGVGGDAGADGGTITLQNGSGSNPFGTDGPTLIQAGALANGTILKIQAANGATDFVRVLAGGSLATYKGANVASTAAMTLTGGNIFHITGTDAITSMNTCDATNAGREVTLIFDSTLTFTDGNNLKLAGNFSTSADDTIRLVCDGSNWYEQSRSVN